MTLDEFFAALEATPRDWVLIKTKIRRHGPCGIPQCPITALCNSSDDHFREAARELHIDSNLAKRIGTAADYDYSKHYTGLRRRLLAVCGLEENA